MSNETKSSLSSDQHEHLAMFLSRTATYSVFDELSALNPHQTSGLPLSLAKALISEYLLSSTTNVIIDKSLYELAMDAFRQLFPTLTDETSVGLTHHIAITTFNHELPCAASSQANILGSRQKIQEFVEHLTEEQATSFFQVGAGAPLLIVGDVKDIQTAMKETRLSNIADIYYATLKKSYDSVSAFGIPTGYLETFGASRQLPIKDCIGKAIWNDQSPLPISSVDKKTKEVTPIKKDDWEVANTIVNYFDVIFYIQVKTTDVLWESGDLSFLKRVAIGKLQVGDRLVFAVSLAKLRWTFVVRAIASILPAVQLTEQGLKAFDS